MPPANSCPRCGRPSPSANNFCAHCGAPLSSPTDGKGWKLLLGVIALFAGLLWVSVIYTRPGAPARLAGESQPRTLVGTGQNSNAPQVTQAAPPTPAAATRRQAGKGEKKEDKKSDEAVEDGLKDRDEDSSSSSSSSSSKSSTPSSRPAPRQSSPASTAGAGETSSDDYYTNSRGERVRRPTRSETGPPAGASAQCRDGTYSFSRSRRGTCSHHGGVARWL